MIRRTVFALALCAFAAVSAFHLPAAAQSFGGYPPAGQILIGQGTTSPPAWNSPVVWGYQVRAAMAQRKTYVFDDFDVLDGTLINGRVTPTGQTWACTGTGGTTATIVGGAWTNPTLTNNTYCYLPYGATLTRVAGAFDALPVVSPTSPGDMGVTLIADAYAGGGILNTMLHLQMGQSTWALDKRINAGAFNTIANGSYNLSSYGSLYSASIDLTKIANNSVTLRLPDGSRVVVTDSDIGTNIIPVVGVWQIGNETNSTVNNRWHSAELGFSDADIYAGSGHAAPAYDLTLAKGFGYSQAQRINQGSVTLSGGPGWYRIATTAQFLAYMLAGHMRFDVQNGTYSSVCDFDFEAIYANSVNLSQRYCVPIVGVPIDEARISYDTGTGGPIAALDLHFIETSPASLNYVLEGFGTLIPNPVVGATVLPGANATLTFTANGGAVQIANLGTGVNTALGVNVGSAGAFVVNGGVLGTPSSGTLTSATGLPISTGLTGAGTGVLTALGNAVNATGGLTTFGTDLPLDGSGTMTANLNMGNFAIINSGGLTGSNTTTLAIVQSNLNGATDVSPIVITGGNNIQASGTHAASAVTITSGSATGAGSTGNAGNINFVTGTSVGGTAGNITINSTAAATCSGSPTSSFASTKGIVTHC